MVGERMEKSNLIKKRVNYSQPTIENLQFPVIVLMYVAIFTVFSFPSYHIYTGPVIATLMLFLSFTDYYYVIVAALIMGNSSLKNIFMGNIQFHYFVAVLIVMRIILNNTYIIRKKILTYAIVVVLIFSHYLIIEGISTFRPVLLTVLMFICVLYVLNDFGDNTEKLYSFLLHIGLVAFTSALSSVIFGGIKYHSTEYGIRYGVAGAGVGDPNFSGIYLVAGLTIILQTKFLKWYVKLPMLIIFFLAISKTMSMTAFLLLILILVAYLIIDKPPEKAFLISIICILIVGTFLFIYEVIPGFEISAVEAYKERLTDKFTELESGSITSFTTGRSYLLSEYWQDFKQQYPMKILFGGNKILLDGVVYSGDELVSHNTFIDLLRRYGLIVTTIMIVIIIVNFLKSLKIYYDTKDDKKLCLLKILYIAAAFTVTIHRSDSYILWFTFLFII